MMTTISRVEVPCSLNYYILADVCTAIALIIATLDKLQAHTECLDHNLLMSPLLTPGTSPHISTRLDLEKDDNNNGADTQNSSEI